MAGENILQFCGLHAKSYSIASEKQHKMAAAGVKRCLQKHLRHEDYVDIIASSSLSSVTQQTIISKKHRIYVQSSVRTALSYLDIKRIVLPNGVDTVPYGYKFA